MRRGVRAVRLKGLWVHPRSGRAYYRTRRDGKTVLVPLPPDLPHDHPDFVAAWSAAARGNAPPESPKAGTLASSWAALLASDIYHARARTYRDMLAREGRLICEKAGGVKIAALAPRHIHADVARAPNPGSRHKAWRFWGAYCRRQGWLAQDVTRKVERPAQPKTDGHPTWSHDDIAAFRAAYRLGTVARAIFELTYWTGARISDVVRIGPQHVGRDGVLVYRQQKTGDDAYVPWSCPLPNFALASDLDAARAAIGTARGLTYLQTAQGRPRSHKAAGHALSAAARAIGIDKSAHGLRKARAATLAEHGASELAIGAWTGHRSLSEIVHYTREMNRRSLVTGTSREPRLETTSRQTGNHGSK